MANLTTTSYAVLGLLNLKPHSAYELASQAGRSLRYTWPTAASRLYAEPKRLAELGLIRIQEQAAGPRRTRQAFRITGRGRTALREWLTTDPRAPRLDAEILLRVLFADAAPTADLVQSLRHTREQVLEEHLQGRELLAQYERGEVPFPERLHLNLVWVAFVREFLQLMHDWTYFAEEEAKDWDRTGHGDSPRAHELLRQIIAGDPVIVRRDLDWTELSPANAAQ